MEKVTAELQLKNDIFYAITIDISHFKYKVLKQKHCQSHVSFLHVLKSLLTSFVAFCFY